MLLPPPTSTLFPYTTLCRSLHRRSLGREVPQDRDLPARDAGGERGDRRDLRAPMSRADLADRKSTRLNSSHTVISYAVFCLKKKKKKETPIILPCTVDHPPA